MHTAKVTWQKQPDENFLDQKYSRGHLWQFDGGAQVFASSSPHVVPLPYSVEANVDPEEAFIASIASCHMLFFLSIAAKQGFVVQRYSDSAVATMVKNDNGQLAISRVELSPSVEFLADSPSVKPSLEEIEQIHHVSHQQCFIANSVSCEIVINSSDKARFC